MKLSLRRILPAAALVAALLPGATAHASTVSQAWPLSPRQLADMPGTVSEVSLAEAPTYSGAQCHNYFFPVTLSPTDTTVHKMFGQLCTKNPAKLGKQPIQLLIHGGTYDHQYYDWPYQPERYNYVRYMTERGYTTLNLDRLGDGRSDHPRATELNFNVAAFNEHQLIQYLRGGGLGVKFGKVVANGYSMGGLTSQVEAATYHDIDAVAVHAVGHQLITPRSMVRLSSAFYPAGADPKFASEPRGADPGYLTSIPGGRTLFYGPASSFDPAQLPLEEQYKQTVSMTELTDITAKSYTDLTKGITAPVLWSPGQYDRIWCDTTDDCNTDPETTNEPGYYAPGVVTIHVVQNSDHATLLGFGGLDYLSTIVSWLGAHGISGVR